MGEFIMNFSSNYLNLKGRIYFEINENLSYKLDTLSEKYSYNSIIYFKDNFGKNRILVLEK